MCQAALGAICKGLRSAVLSAGSAKPSMHVSILRLPIVVLLHENCADIANFMTRAMKPRGGLARTSTRYPLLTSSGGDRECRSR